MAVYWPQLHKKLDLELAEIDFNKLDPTSNLDPENGIDIQRAIENLEKANVLSVVHVG